MSRVPFLGHAVHAPIVTAPNATPRLTASHVAPRPSSAATNRANKDPSTNRTGELSHQAAWQDMTRTTNQLPLPTDRAARDSGDVTPAPRSPVVAGPGLAAIARVASSIIRSTRCRMSAARLVNSVGRMLVSPPAVASATAVG